MRDQLKEELERRKKERNAFPRLKRHYEPLKIVDFIESEIQAVRTKPSGRLCKDFEHYLYQKVIVTFYGDNALKWFSDRL